MMKVVLIAFASFLVLQIAFAYKPSSSEEESSEDAKGVEGTEAAPHEFPHQVALLYNVLAINISNLFNCGGSLISPEWILTSAHCIGGGSFDPAAVKVLLGAHNQSNVDEPNQVMVSVTELVAQEGVNANNALGLVKIDAPSDLVKPGIIEPIALAEKGEEPQVGSDVIVAGWGRDTPDTNPNSTNMDLALRKVRRKVIPFKRCAKVYNSAKGTEGSICTKAKSGDKSCLADAGGPTVIRVDKDVLKLVGVNNLPSGMTCQGQVNLLTSVAANRDWIKANAGV